MTFTDNTQEILRNARNLAIQCQSRYITAPQLAFCLLEHNISLLKFVFRPLGGNLSAFISALEPLLSTTETAATPEKPLDAGATNTVNEAARLARELGEDIIAPEHLFWGLAQSENPVATILKAQNICGEDLKRGLLAYRVEALMPGSAPTAPEEAQQQATATPEAENKPIPNALAPFVTDLSAKARAGKASPAYGRDEEIQRTLRALCRKTKNNPLLVGKPGIGKTAIVEGIANRLLHKDVPEELRQMRLLLLDLTALNADCGLKGDFEKRMRDIIQAVNEQPEIVLFIDEIHMLMKSGGSMDAANILKPAMSRGTFRIIGATTEEEYRTYIGADKAFERRFQKILVEEPTEEDAISILRSLKTKHEEYFGIRILDEALTNAVRLSVRYIHDRVLPDKAIDVLEEAAARMKAQRAMPSELDSLRRRLQQKEAELESLRSEAEIIDTPNNRKELATLKQLVYELRDREKDLTAQWEEEKRWFERQQHLETQLRELTRNIRQAEQGGQSATLARLQQQKEELENALRALDELPQSDSGKALLKRALDAENIREIISEMTGIPATSVSPDEQEELQQLRETLQKQVIGQPEATSAVARVLRRNRMGLVDERRPIGSFLFIGPSGTGKTELAKCLAAHLFKDANQMTRIDMSEYQQEHSVNRLFGAPPGYIGYDHGGQLTEAILRKPHSVVLLDEIEKAHPKVFETLLQVLDDGRMTDGQGRVVNFCHTIIIMTSNIAQKDILQVFREHGHDGQGTAEGIQAAKEKAMSELRGKMAPEFINRIDDIVMFRPLDRSSVRSIIKLKLSSMLRKWSEKNGAVITAHPNVEDFLLKHSYTLEYGARPANRAIERYVNDGLVDAIASGEVQKGKPIFILLPEKDDADARLRFINLSSTTAS